MASIVAPPPAPPKISPAHPRASITALPHYALVDIVDYLSMLEYPYYREKGIWKSRYISRAFRDAADVVLKRSYLSHQQIAPAPYLGNDIWSDTWEDLAEDDRKRRNELRVLTRRFMQHVTAYPESGRSLRSLNVELRDDEDTAGWSILTRFASQLQEAEISVWDRLWQKKETKDYGESLAEDCANTFDVWDRTLDFGDITFPLLTKITLICTARLIAHLVYLLRSTPALVDLTLSCRFGHIHYGLEDDFDVEGVEWEMPPNLRSLTIHGDKENVVEVLSTVLPDAHSLSDLTINLTNGCATQYTENILGHLCAHGALDRLALYGSSVPNLIADLFRLEGDIGRPLLPSLRVLVLEQRYWNDQDDFAPLLDSPVDQLPSLPLLESITYVQRYDRSYRGGTPDSVKYRDVYDPFKVRKLATHYPALRSIIFVCGDLEEQFNVRTAGIYGAEIKCRIDWKEGTMPCEPGEELDKDPQNKAHVDDMTDWPDWLREYTEELHRVRGLDQ